MGINPQDALTSLLEHMQQPLLQQFHFARQMQQPLLQQLHLVQHQAILQQQAIPNDAIPYPCNYDAIPYAGVQVGEIIAWRAWRVRVDGRLLILNSAADRHRLDELLATDPRVRLISVARWTHWKPGKPMTGNIDAPLDSYPFREGVFAFGGRSSPLQLCLKSRTVHAVGQVALYGEVVEHELGYRASHAMIHSIDEVGGQMTEDRRLMLLSRLRAAYLTDDRGQKTDDR
jgi:hypothetical protein